MIALEVGDVRVLFEMYSNMDSGFRPTDSDQWWSCDLLEAFGLCRSAPKERRSDRSRSFFITKQGALCLEDPAMIAVEDVHGG